MRIMKALIRARRTCHFVFFFFFFYGRLMLRESSSSRFFRLAAPTTHCRWMNKFWCLLLSLRTTKPTKWYVRPAKTQISLGIRPVWSEALQSAWRNLGCLSTHWAHSEDSDQTGWMQADDQADLSLRWAHRPVGFVMRRLFYVHSPAAG